MTFLETVFARLEQAANTPVLREIRLGEITSVTGAELLVLIQRARLSLSGRGLKKGDRCALVAPNSIDWVAADLAMMAEGLIVVPLYARQAPSELAAMMKDSTPAWIFSDDTISAELRKVWLEIPQVASLDTLFTREDVSPMPLSRHSDSDALTIIYTSGTSGEPKGVVLNVANVNHMLGCTNGRLDQLMKQGTRHTPDRIFHYLPFCFAGSWILLLTALSRNSILTLSTDLSKLSDELKVAAPDYFLNVPALLERVRAKIEESIEKRGGLVASIFRRARQARLQRDSRPQLLDALCLSMASYMIFPTIRKSIGTNLKALICGSAPLSVETQLFFMMLGIPVLQVYGLTETTAICTMDDPGRVEPGRVGVAIPGIEMITAETGEVLVRGPNIFPGYWQRPAETAKVFKDGWFHTGDQGAVDARGNWEINGRLKNLIILNSGHNVAPEPIEQVLMARLPDAQHVVLVGNQRSFLAALVTGTPAIDSHSERIQSAIDEVNSGLPHYKQIRAFHALSDSFTIENGLLTANGKLKRDAIAARFSAQIENLYRKKSS